MSDGRQEAVQNNSWAVASIRKLPPTCQQEYTASCRLCYVTLRMPLDTAPVIKAALHIASYTTLPPEAALLRAECEKKYLLARPVGRPADRMGEY